MILYYWKYRKIKSFYEKRGVKGCEKGCADNNGKERGKIKKGCEKGCEKGCDLKIDSVIGRGWGKVKNEKNLERV